MNLIFDFDGTLADTLDMYVAIGNEILKEYGMDPVTKEEVQKKGLKKLIKERGIKLYQIPKLLLYGRKKLKNKVSQIKLFQGIKSVLEDLNDKHKLGILTSNSVENVEKVLKKNNILDLFDLVYSEFNLFGKDKKLKNIIKKYNLPKEQTIYIGDETRDIEAAKRVGIQVLAVEWGYESLELLKEAGPDKIISTPNDLLAL